MEGKMSEQTEYNAVSARDGEPTDAGSRSTAAQAAFARGRLAFPQWSGLTVKERLQYVRRLRLLIAQRNHEVASVISAATGKPTVEALSTEILVVLEAMRYLEKTAAPTLATRKVGTPLVLFGKKSYVQFKPRGVVLVISPWNVPFQLSMIPVLEALVAGNCVILKPSEVVPAVGELIGRLFGDAGFPEGTVQVVQGDGKTGGLLVEQGPDFIHFTGSVPTGRRIQQVAAERLIPTTLELGGKDPMIVFADANLKRAVHGALWGALCNSGQICMSVERIYVQRPVYDTFVRILAQEMLTLRQSSSADGDIGRMTVPNQVRIVKSHVSQALEDGAQLVSGNRPDEWRDEDMTIKPVLLLNVKQSMAVMQEETFGPVLPVVPFSTEAEAVQLAGETRFGLSCSVWTQDLTKARRVVECLAVGGATINDVIMAVANPYLPYGGVKEGGIGRYHGEEGLKSFSVETSVVVDSGKREREVNWFPYANKEPYFSLLIANWYGERRKLLGFGRAFLKLLSISRKASGPS